MPDPRKRFGDDTATMVSIVTAEHTALETARSATIFEAGGRVGSYLATVSGVAIAVAFIGEVADLGLTFPLVPLVLLPALLFLGIVTFERVLQSAAEDGILARRVNRLSRFYVDVAPALAEYIVPAEAEESLNVVVRQHGLEVSRRWQSFLGASGMVGIINSLIAGVFIAVVAHLVSASLLASVSLGIATWVLSVVLHDRRQQAVWSRWEANAVRGHSGPSSRTA